MSTGISGQAGFIRRGGSKHKQGAGGAQHMGTDFQQKQFLSNLSLVTAYGHTAAKAQDRKPDSPEKITFYYETRDQ